MFYVDVLLIYVWFGRFGVGIMLFQICFLLEIIIFSNFRGVCRRMAGFFVDIQVCKFETKMFLCLYYFGCRGGQYIYEHSLYYKIVFLDQIFCVYGETTVIINHGRFEVVVLHQVI
eukprot:TRINITY_DN610_c0_g1_i1.p4 TRINITY_DN610_c0_g1~~TRINITY_DN610_c0_g1_i1.p4  ORF type:complete len:116 (+),score=0.29 TRINITY_DN610_c0_g1_i1:212-559(+)